MATIPITGTVGNASVERLICEHANALVRNRPEHHVQCTCLQNGMCGLTGYHHQCLFLEPEDHVDWIELRRFAERHQAEQARLAAGERIKAIIGEAAIQAFLGGEEKTVVDVLAMLAQLDAGALGELDAVFDEARAGEPLPDLMYAWAEVATGAVSFDTSLARVDEELADATLREAEISRKMARLSGTLDALHQFERVMDQTFITHPR